MQITSDDLDKLAVLTNVADGSNVWIGINGVSK